MADDFDEAELEQLEADMKKANAFIEDAKGRFDRIEGLMVGILQSIDKLDRRVESSSTRFTVGSSSYAIPAAIHTKGSDSTIDILPESDIYPTSAISVSVAAEVVIIDNCKGTTTNTEQVDNDMAHTTIVLASPVTFVDDPSFPLLQDPVLCDLKRAEFGFLPPTVSYPSHFIFIFGDRHKLDDDHDGVLFLHPYSAPVTDTTHFNDNFLCLSQTAKSIEVWTSNQFLASVIFTILDYHDLTPLQSIIYRSTFDPGISFPLALLLKCSICFFQGLFNESEEFSRYSINLNKDIAQLWFLIYWTRHLELEVGPTITLFYYVHSGFLPFTTCHCSCYSWGDGYAEAKLFLLLMLTVANQLLGVLLFDDTFVVPSIYLSFWILMIRPHNVSNIFSSLISVFDPGISVRASCLVEAGAYYHFPCWDSCLTNSPSSMKLVKECTTTLIGAITWDTIFSKSLCFHFLPSIQSHVRSLSELITRLNDTFIEHYTYFISNVLKWGLKMHKDFMDHGKLYVGALIIATVMLLFNGMADLSIISGTFLVHYEQRDLLLYSAWAYVIVENAGSTGYVEIITAAVILIVVSASCFLVVLYKMMSFWFAEVLVVLFCIGGIEGLQTCLVVLLACFRWFQPVGQTFVKVPFPGAVSYFTLTGCIGYINWTTPHISKVQDFPVLLVLVFVLNHYSLFLIDELQHYGIAIGDWSLVGANLHLLFLCSVVVPEISLRLLISTFMLSSCLFNATWNSLDFPTWQVFFF